LIHERGDKVASAESTGKVLSHLTETFNWDVTKQNSRLFPEQDESGDEANCCACGYRLNPLSDRNSTPIPDEILFVG